MKDVNRYAVIGMKDVVELLFSRATVNRRMKTDPFFPKPFKFNGSKRNYWLLGDILDYIERSAKGGLVVGESSGSVLPAGQINLTSASNDSVAVDPIALQRNGGNSGAANMAGTSARVRTVEVQVRKTRTYPRRTD